MSTHHKPIALSRSQWEHLHRWMDVSKDDADAARRKDYIQYLNETSNLMTKSWPNSLENIKKRNEEIRRARLEAAEQANSKFYHKYVKRKKEEQRKMMHSARDTIFKNKDAPKLLLSAVIESVTQKDRTEQLKFAQERQKEAAMLAKQYDEDVVLKAKEWNELQKLKKKRRFEINKQHQKDILEQAKEVSERNQKDILEQAKEVAERNQKEYEAELSMQQFDNIKAREEIEAIKEFEESFQAAEKARIWSAMKAARMQDEALKREQRERAQMDERLQEVLLRSKARVDAKVKQVDREARKEKLRMLEEISKRLVSDDAAREAKEQASRDNAARERIAAEDARAEAKREKAERMKAERQAGHAAHLEDEARRLHEFHTLRQWEIMNRFKNDEIFEDYKEQNRQKNKEKILEYRERILKQWREREEREARERAETRHFYGAAALREMRDADNKLLTHAAALVQEARRRGRPDYPIQRAVHRFCLLNRLYPMPDLPASMQEHFPHYEPRDGTEPDPRYKDSPPPSQADNKEQQRSQLEKYSAGKTDDINEVNSESKTKLPPITTIPCPGTKCNCGLKREDN